MSTFNREHNAKMKEFEKKKQQLPQLQTWLKNCREELRTSKWKKTSPARLELVQHIGELERQIKELEMGTEETEYLLDVGQLLVNHHKKKQQRYQQSDSNTASTLYDCVFGARPNHCFRLPGSTTEADLCRKLGVMAGSQNFWIGGLRLVDTLDTVAMAGRINIIHHRLRQEHLSRERVFLVLVPGEAEQNHNPETQLAVPLDATPGHLDQIMRSLNKTPDADANSYSYDVQGLDAEWVTITTTIGECINSEQKETVLRVRYNPAPEPIRVVSRKRKEYNGQKKKTALQQIIKRRRINDRGTLYKEYMVKMGKMRPDQPKEDPSVCPLCDSSMVYHPHTSTYVCPGYEEEVKLSDGNTIVERRSCGYSRQHFNNDESSLPYGHQVEVILTESSYKRINHFNEWLAQTQGKERTVIPDWIIRDVRRELAKYRYKVKDVDRKRIRKILKKLDKMHKGGNRGKPKYSKYYEHAAQITSIITGVPSPRMTPEMEHKLKAMFYEIQLPFEQCPSSIKRGRTNFLSYAFVLYKLCELNGWDEFLPYFPLLKSDDRLRVHCAVWRYICKELEWPYYLTSNYS